MSFKRFSAAVVSLVILLSFSACRDSGRENDPSAGKNGFFTTVLAGNPSTLDPQTCTGDNSAQLIANMFRGLYAFSDGGKTVPAMAEECSVSDDGLEWKFRLSDNIRWYGEDGFSAQCTADDFVFAFQRLMDPSLRSERAAEYYCIKNAEKIHTGRIKDPDALGVKAIGEFELTIILERPCPCFDALLASAPAMPCNREFYEKTEGQYGLVEDCIGSNGNFYLSRWHYDKWVEKDNFIELRRNDLNKDALGTAPRGVRYMINENDYENFPNGNADVCLSTDPSQIARLSGKYPENTYSGGVWGILFNNNGVFSDIDLRIALSEYVKLDTVSDVFLPADRIIVDGSAVGDTDYRSSAGYPEHNRYSEQELLERARRGMFSFGENSLSGMKLLVPEGSALKQELGTVIQQWQKKYGIYFMISELSPAEYNTALEKGDFTAAVVRLCGDSAVSYLTSFSAASVKNYADVRSAKLDDILSGALSAGSGREAAAYCLEAEQFILDNCYFAPLCFENEHIFFSAGVSDIGYVPSSGTYLFADALRK